jgi:flagellar hook-length control protein FliK
MSTTPIDITLSPPERVASPSAGVDATVGENTFGQHLRPNADEPMDEHAEREDIAPAGPSAESRPTSPDGNEETEATAEVSQPQKEAAENDDKASGEVDNHEDRDDREEEDAAATLDQASVVVVGQTIEEPIPDTESEPTTRQEETNAENENKSTIEIGKARAANVERAPTDGQAASQNASPENLQAEEAGLGGHAAAKAVTKTDSKPTEEPLADDSASRSATRTDADKPNTADETKFSPSIAASKREEENAEASDTPQTTVKQETATKAAATEKREISPKKSGEVSALGQTSESASPHQEKEVGVVAAEIETDAKSKSEIGADNGESKVEGARGAEPGQTPPRGPQQWMAAMERTGRGTPLNAAEQGRFVNRVVKALEAAQLRGGEIRLRLHPPELGALRLEVRVEAGAIHARLEAETPLARNLLIENMAALRERLAEQNVRVEQFDVDLMDRQPQGWADAQQKDQQHHFGTSTPDKSTPSAETTASEEESTLPPSTTDNDALNVII